MKLTRQQIHECVDRYYRERDRYEKLTRIIEDLCYQALIDEASLQVNIGSRTKRVNSFAGKLKRFALKKQKADWASVDDVFSGLSDFSGIRIVYYSSTDLISIKSSLTKVFGKLDFDEKDNIRSGKGYYQAVHCQVKVPEPLLVGDNENLIGLEAEIQITSMMSHVWNEIEHDISYKPIGEVSHDEKELLDSLGQIKTEGDAIILKLMSIHKSRRAAEDQLVDENAVQLFIKNTFDIRRDTTSDGMTKLLQIMNQLDISDKRDFKRWLGVGSNESFLALREVWKKAKAEIIAFNRFLEKEGKGGLALSPRNSADPAILLVLKNNYKKILKQMPAGRGMGRPQKIRILALQYERYMTTKY